MLACRCPHPAIRHATGGSRQSKAVVGASPSHEMSRHSSGWAGRRVLRRRLRLKGVCYSDRGAPEALLGSAPVLEKSLPTGGRTFQGRRRDLATRARIPPRTSASRQPPCRPKLGEEFGGVSSKVERVFCHGSWMQGASCGTPATHTRRHPSRIFLLRHSEVLGRMTITYNRGGVYHVINLFKMRRLVSQPAEGSTRERERERDQAHASC